ncbi:uncharacterized protein LOC132927069 [Rhopalosiphum padi]|uniref:uncharacterized protein LOC132927069 n=1 Tax=Rhopalosiphum padi TaxID=40932 RepID=UPI00298E1FDD|nr:uncharacterized protein LOC132927069 [Rhopalosiphum padi]
MYFRCMLTMQDLNDPQSNPQTLLSCVRVICDASDYYLCVWNSLYPHDAYFDLAMLSKINHEFVAEGKLGLEFKKPKQLLTINTQYVTLLNMFYLEIKDILEGKKVYVETRRVPKLVFSTKAVMNHFDPLAVEFVSVDRFDNRLLNMRNLTTLTMKNCDLPTIPVEIGHLPIEYLDISGSKLPINQDTFWDWMSMTVICGTLATLRINSIGLTRLPFEIMFLKRLETLFATNNKLTYLPKIICELKILRSLFVADNKLVYLPYCLSRLYVSMDISNNLIIGTVSPNDSYLYKYIMELLTIQKIDVKNVVPSLSHLSLYSLMDNCVPFKRQDIPRTLWINLNVMGRCDVCKRWTQPEYCRVGFKYIVIHSILDGDKLGPGQLMTCRNEKNCKRLV